MGVKNFVDKYFLGHDDEDEDEAVSKKTKPPEKKASKPKPAAKPAQPEKKPLQTSLKSQTEYKDYTQGASYLNPQNDLNGGNEMNERFKSNNNAANNGNNNSGQYSRPANSYSSQPQQSSGNINNMNNNSNNQNGTNREVKIAAQTTLQIVLARPVEFSESKAIAKELNNQKTVLLNLELVEQKEARRILDFLAGVAFANDGDIKMMAQNTFAFMPKNVGFSGVDLMSELENNGLGF